jgi:hypothetical protein
MRVPHLHRAPRAAVPALALAVAGLTVACADGPTAPVAAPARALLATSTTGTSTVTLTIAPTTTATFTVNSHRVKIVAGSVCDPATAGYGPALWDAPCQPAATTVRVTAKAWTGADGRPVVTFSPDLRFVPGKVNTIWLLDRAAAAQQTGVLAWCPTGAATCVDEGKTDASLVTQYTADGYAYRRLKHFSGYTVVAN